MMNSKEIRKSFIHFFEQRGHTIVPSAPVIPHDDPTLLFTNAGMNQFKDLFLGTGRREYKRAVNSQKCIRVSGKHNDLEEVGRDTYHHTFFEMLGNWSFGDYYKKEAIGWAWELLTEEWKLDSARLYATVFETDDEAERCWKEMTTIDHSHVLRFGKKDNFWEMGETGPCGPCSEIHIDLTPDHSGLSLVNAGDPRVMEIWNLVFIQYNRDERENLTPLPSKHVDTGMGFERMCAVLQKKQSNYETDLFVPIIQSICEITGKRYQGDQASEPQLQTDIAIRVVADHVRMLTFSIADGGIPSNEGRGYVMRRILRRAARFGRNLGMHQPFLYKTVTSVVAVMGEQYPEIREKQAHIERVIKGEEESFNSTLDRGLEIFESVARRIASAVAGTRGPGLHGVFPGEEAFKLYDTFGFPLDLTELMAQERGMSVDAAAFHALMEVQRARSRSEGSTPAGRTIASGTKEEARKFDTSGIENRVTFVGYDLYESEAKVLRAHRNLLVIDRSPFYAESGGQVGDEGEIQFNGNKLRVADTVKSGTASVLLLDSEVAIEPETPVRAKINVGRRLKIMKNHTATHLVHEALRRVLGAHAHQQGSLVAPDHLRFDYNHFEGITPDQIRAIEEMVNEKIVESILVEAENDPTRWMTIDDAKKRYPNVKMFFGEKYGKRVRVVVIDPKFSVELCGGTHVKNTGDIGLFKIIAESGIASGVRRIEAVTGDGLGDYIRKRLQKAGELDEQIARLVEEKEDLERQLGLGKSSASLQRPSLRRLPVLGEGIDAGAIASVETALGERGTALEVLTKDTHELKKHMSEVRIRNAASNLERLVASGVSVNGFIVVSARIDAGDLEELKRLGDALRSKLSSGVGILGAVVDEKVALVCVVTDDLVKGKKLQAGRIVGELAKRLGGGGGGRPHLATAGGKDISKLDDTLKQAPKIIQSILAS
ncbi:MAG TPA: alanine--tRNA ligase [Bacteroidota bacterium]|nr:alanine--tRNA ligase [Bacteroidota bacterium]